jgi:hypothetical protein
MNAIAEIFANARASSRLKPKFHRATSVVGMLATFAGIAFMYLVAIALAAALGLDFDAPVRESTGGLLWVGLFLAAIPLCFFLAMIPVAWLCGHVLFRIGYMEREDIKYYALRSRYPRHWFKEHGRTSMGAGRNAA